MRTARAHKLSRAAAPPQASLGGRLGEGVARFFGLAERAPPLVPRPGRHRHTTRARIRRCRSMVERMSHSSTATTTTHARTTLKRLLLAAHIERVSRSSRMIELERTIEASRTKVKPRKRSGKPSSAPSSSSSTGSRQRTQRGTPRAWLASRGRRSPVTARTTCRSPTRESAPLPMAKQPAAAAMQSQKLRPSASLCLEICRQPAV